MNATRDASLKIICHELVPWRSDCVASVVPFGGGSLKGRKWNVNRDSPFQMFNYHFHPEFFCCCRFFFQFDFDENILLHEMKRWKRIYRWFRHSFLRKHYFLTFDEINAYVWLKCCPFDTWYHSKCPFWIPIFDLLHFSNGLDRISLDFIEKDSGKMNKCWTFN